MATATIFDIAREARVSPSTVSLVTSGAPNVHADTRKRVQAVIDRLGYKPRPMRARKRKTRDLNLALIYQPSPIAYGHMTDMTLEYVEGILKAFTKAGVRPSVLTAAGPLDEDPVFKASLEAQQIDGAILIGADMPREGYFDQVIHAGVPALALNRKAEHAEFSSVSADYHQGSRLATERLIALGHRRLAFTALKGDHWPSRERLRGHLDALAHHGIEPVETLLREQALIADRQSFLEVFSRRALDQGVTAFALSDHHAQLVVPILEQLGKQVPEDISVIGFDDLGLTVGKDRKKLTSIATHRDFTAELAVKTLLELAGSRGMIRHADKTVATSLVEGDTTAPPASP